MGRTLQPDPKNVILSIFAEKQKAQYITKYSEKIVVEIVKGMMWFVAHDPFSYASPVPNRPGRWLIVAYTQTSPVFELSYVFKDASNQREILKFNLKEIK